MIENKPRAVLFRVGGLGDLLVALPAITLVRRGLPGHLVLVGRAEYAALFVQAGIVDEAISFDDPRVTAVFSVDPGTSGREQEKARGATGPVPKPSLDHEPRPAPLDGVSLAMGWWNRTVDWPADDWWKGQGIGRTSFVTYDDSSGLPMSRFFFDRTLGFFHAEGGDALFDDCARLELPAAAIKSALGSLGLRPLGPGEKRLVIHPGSGGRAKRWPLANFLEVVRHAASLGYRGVVVTGEAEEDLEPSLRAVTLPIGWTHVLRLPTETLAGLLASSTQYIGNDSGPTHLAAACGARVLAFFLEANLTAWRPFGRTRVISAPLIDRFGVSAAIPVIDDFLAS